MKMARASEQDLEAALTVSRIIEELEKGYMPGDDNAEETEFFDQDDPEHSKRALDAILSAAQQGSIFRVTFGMAVVLDPRNKVLDPDADTLELHPDLVRTAASVAAPAAGDALDAKRYRWLRDPKTDPALVLDKRTGYVPEDESVPGVGGYHTYEYRAGEELDAAIDAAIAAIAQQKGEA